jgi:hypothetical protein
MIRSLSRIAFFLFAAASIQSAAWAQPPVQQVLKDAWVASNRALFQVDYGEQPAALVGKNPGDVTRSFKAVAFQFPDESGRNLIAVDGTRVFRFVDGTNEEAPVLLFDASAAPADLSAVNTIATPDDGTVLFSGYSKRKRVFELWVFDPSLPAAQRIQLKVTGTPQLTDAVHVGADDVVAGSRLEGGGLLAAAGRNVLFFPAASGYATMVLLFDARTLPIRNNTQLLSVDLVRKTDALMVTTSERQLIVTSPFGANMSVFANVPDIAGRQCGNLRPQRLLVRNARGGDEATSIVTDACGQALRYDFVDPSSTFNNPVATTVHSEGLLAVAVGEGNQVICQGGQPCTLVSGYETQIETADEVALLVLQLENLCDRRVLGSACNVGVVNPDNSLDFNSLLPSALRDALLANGVEITIPPYMFGAGPDGAFGALIVQSDEIGAAARVSAVLDIQELLGFELGVRQDFVRTTPIISLLNQDIAAYAPDNPLLPTVRGFEATPVAVGSGSLKIGVRGYSVVTYGVMHDFNPAGPRAAAGGLPTGTVLDYGSPPLCDLALGALTFTAVDDPPRYFLNLAACLFADLETLLTDEVLIPDSAFVFSGDRATLTARLDNTKDKLIKALNANGPNAGSENYQSVISQLDNFDAALQATQLTAQYAIYKNELEVRSEVFRFNLLFRALPSLPPGGFAP